MSNFATSLLALLTHPFGWIALALAAALWLFLRSRSRRYERIAAELTALPPARRRYTLEREYKIFPGREQSPLSFVRTRRTRWRIAAGLTAVLALGGFLGAAGYSAWVARKAVWELDDESIARESDGYAWRIELVNHSREPVRVEALRLEILRTARHPGIRTSSPVRAPQSSSRRLVTLKPSLEAVAILDPGEQFSLGSRQTRTLRLFINASHRSNEGWIYDVRLQARWQSPGRTASFSKYGRTYRLGWPGIGQTAGSRAKESGWAPLADPVETVEP